MTTPKRIKTNNTRRLLIAVIVGWAGVFFANTAISGPFFGAPMMQGSFNISSQQWQDPQTYYLGIAVSGVPSELVEIKPMGHTIMVRVQHSKRTQQQSPGASFGMFQSNQMVHHSFNLPQDADMSRMHRKNGPGRVLIAVPRWQSAP